MRRIWLVLLLGFCATATAGESPENSREPDALGFISQQEYLHEAHVSFRLRFSLWVMLGPVLEKSAVALKPHFRSFGMCADSNASDVVVWLRPYLSYNPIDGYHARVDADFYLGNGKRMGSLTTTAVQRGWMGSVFAEDEVQKAFDAALQDIARQYAVDGKLHEAIRAGLAKGIARVPCHLSVLAPPPSISIH
jgi:hypothetical protein